MGSFRRPVMTTSTQPKQHESIVLARHCRFTVTAPVAPSRQGRLRQAGDRGLKPADGIPKLMVRVRFPPPARSPEGSGQDVSPEPGPWSFLGRFRAAVPLSRAASRPGQLRGPGGFAVPMSLCAAGSTF